MATKFQGTGTATDYLGYVDYHDSAGYDYIDRLPSSKQEWVLGDWDGEKYVITFDKNFSKKHLFTFEKKKDNVEKAAYYLGQANPNRAPQENWQLAEHELLEKNIAHKLIHRTNAYRKCTCSHTYAQHGGGNACNVGACGCARFATAYQVERVQSGREDNDPLAGASTNRNTCIVLNYIPKIEFESVVVGSICAHEKPNGGRAIAKAVGDEVVLKWDFGSSRQGVIVQATNGQSPSTWGKLQGVYVKAKKVGTAVGWQTWQVFHLETSGGHAPF